jgi:hypothetical protein
VNQTLGFGLFAVGVALAANAGFGCATKSLPAGTPPPEYEKRTLEAWPPPSDAGTDDAAPSSSPAEPAPSPGAADGGLIDRAAPPSR